MFAKTTLDAKKIVRNATGGILAFTMGAGITALLLNSSVVLGATVIGSGVTTDGVLKITSNGATNNFVLTSDPNGVASWVAMTTAMDPSHANVTTDAVTEGATNLYYTNARADARSAFQKDTVFAVADATDATKSVVFDVVGSPSTKLTLSTSPTVNRTLTLPDADGALLVADTTTGMVFINQTGALHGSNSGIQYATTFSSRAQIRMNQYGNNSGVPGISTFKSRGTTIGSLAPVQPGDVIFRDTAVGVTDNLSVPLSGLISINVAPNGVPAGQGWIATDYQLQLTPLAGPANGRKEAFRITSEGILHIKEQANAMAGVATLNGAGQAVVANTQITATSRIMLTVQDGGTVPTGFPYLSARSIGTSFTITSSAGAADSGAIIYYQIWEPTTP